MSIGNDNYIAGKRTPADWIAFRANLAIGAPERWQEAFLNYFNERLHLRYLHPIKVLQDNGTLRGEGFSIVAIQCSLIEFLESTIQGKEYRFTRGNSPLGPHEYSSSREMFISFLKLRHPFSAVFDQASADDFYASVRCGLLHEARTKNGWRIWAKSHVGQIIDTQSKIVCRDNFQSALLDHIRDYGQRLPLDMQLQEAFLRKFDSLCR